MLGHDPQSLKRLPERHKILRRLHPGNWIQVSTKIDSNRTNLRVIPKTEANVVRVIAEELIRADRAVDVTAVVEDNAAEIVDQLNREARFGVEDCEHTAAV